MTCAPFTLLLLTTALANSLNLDYLDPTKLQIRAPVRVQQKAAYEVIKKYSSAVIVEVNYDLFQDKKDSFSLQTTDGKLHIRASTAVAAVWGFNYYLKKYCKSQIAWEMSHVSIPSPLPEVNEVIVASDRFRYYQNACTMSYSFVWWGLDEWIEHIQWMALNGINLALGPFAQEAAWAKVYRKLGMTQQEIDQHFTGPAFLSWQRMGNLRGWGGPLFQSWHEMQLDLQNRIVGYMYQFGIVPVFPAFNGHVPRAFSRIFPNATLHPVNKWNKFKREYCCDYFLDPNDPLFKTVGKMFLKEINKVTPNGTIYTADPFNEISITGWTTGFVRNTSEAIFSTLSETNSNAVWLIQNWMFVHDPALWPVSRVEAFLTAVPKGRMLVLDLQSEQWPQYNLYAMYYGQPFIWCMLHNFGGTLGMFGSLNIINNDVYKARNQENSTMIGIGLTPEGINQNYVVYDLMLESGWRKEPVSDLEAWIANYAERRYGCNDTSSAWKSLLHSVYNFEGLNRMRGKYVITRRPSFKITPWAWYHSRDLFDAFKNFVFIKNPSCFNDGFKHDLVDITRQALQYRAEQLYINIVNNRWSTTWIVNSTVQQFLQIMNDLELTLSSHDNFKIKDWLSKARSVSNSPNERKVYEHNARNQITMWGPNGEISDYACKQWAEMFRFYYIPRWTMFLSAFVDSKERKELFDEKATQNVITATVEKAFIHVNIEDLPSPDPQTIALSLYYKWSHTPNLDDLPLDVIKRSASTTVLLTDIESKESGTRLPFL